MRGSPDTCVTIKGWQPQTVAAGLKSNPGSWQPRRTASTRSRQPARPGGDPELFDLPLITGRAAPGLAR